MLSPSAHQCLDDFTEVHCLIHNLLLYCTFITILDQTVLSSLLEAIAHIFDFLDYYGHILIPYINVKGIANPV
jgi:hypothetical protein